MLFKVEYESIMVVIEKISFQVRTIKIACRDHENILKIFEEKENALREEILSLKI